MSKTMIRIVKDNKNPYTMINNHLLRDENLSWKAKGILAYLLSLPDDWKVYETELVKHATDGIDSLRSGINELIENHYIHRTRARGENGKFGGYEYTIYEKPHHIGFSKNGLSKNGKTKNGKTKNGESNTTNTYSTNTYLTNTNSTKELQQERGTKESSSGLQIDENLKLIAKEHEQCGFGTIDFKTKELLEDLLEQYSVEWIVQAFSICVEANKRTIKYARGILENWRREGGMKLGGREDGEGFRGINSKAEEEYGNIKGVTYL